MEVTGQLAQITFTVASSVRNILCYFLGYLKTVSDSRSQKVVYLLFAQKTMEHFRNNIVTTEIVYRQQKHKKEYIMH